MSLFDENEHLSNLLHFLAAMPFGLALFVIAMRAITLAV